MATNFPTSLDNLTNPAGSDPVNNPSHATQHANINDAIEVLEEKVGINNSAVTTSLDYRVKQLETNPTYTNEEARDAIALALRASGGITVSSDDIANTITVSTDSTIATKTYVDTAVSNLGSTAASTYVPVSEVGQADGIATLDATGQVPFSQLGNLVASAPATLDTLNELATALGNDANFATTTATSIGNKVSKAGGDVIQSSLSSVIPLVLKGALSQSVNLQEWQDSTGSTKARVSASGAVVTSSVGVFGSQSAINNSQVTILNNNLSYPALTIKGAASQSANIFEWQNSSGAVVGFINSAGFLKSNYVYVNGLVDTADNGAYLSLNSNGNNGSSVIATNRNAGQIPFAVKGFASQTADLQQWQNSAGTVISRVRSDGQIGIGSTLITSTNFFVNNTFSTTHVVATMRGAVSQTANLQEWQDNAGTVLANVSSSGQFLTPRLTITNGGNIVDSAGTTPYFGFGSNQISLLTRNAAYKGLVIQGSASQTANLQEWQDSAGTVSAFVDANGRGRFLSAILGSTSSSFGSNLNLQTSAASIVGVIIRGNISQTADLQQWQNSAGTVIARINAAGVIGTTQNVYSSRYYYSSNGTDTGTSISFIDGANGGGLNIRNIDLTTPNAAFDNVVPLTISGNINQTANLQNWKNAAGTVLAKVDSTGAMFTTTAAANTNTTQVATTEYVKNNINNLINAAPGTLDTLGEIATALAASDSAAAALVTSVNLKAPLASPALTGTPTAPTAVAGTNTTQLATTAFVKTELSTSIQPGALYQTSAPSSPAVGQIWIDSDEDVTTFDPNIIRRKAITATAGQTVFTADLPFIDGFEQIFMNGLLLVKTTDYATSGGNTVTLTSAAAVSDVIEIVSVTGANSVNTYTQAEVNALLAANTSVAPLSISANTTLVAKKRYFVTSASALTLTLPASPALNDEIQIVDASGSASTYNITVARNANKINGDTVNLIIDTNGGWVTLLYTGSTYGWKVG